MAFDSGSTPQAWMIVIAIWSYPIFPTLVIIGTWIAFAKRKNKLAAILSGISFTPPILCYFFIWITSLIGPYYINR